MRRALLLATCALAGCYTAEFSETAPDVFVCSVDDECSAEASCVGGVCVSDAGPTVAIVGPEEDSVFGVDDSVVFSLTLSGTDLELAEPNGVFEEGRGYITIEVDGAMHSTRIIDGSLQGTVNETLDLGLLEAGFHRIRVRAVGLDNEPYANPSAVADVGIWSNDGLPHVGIRSPWPGDTYVAGAGLDVTVGCLNCTFTDPDLAASDIVNDPVPEGHSHVFFDRREGVSGTLDFPTCLPTCNFDYAESGSIKPSGASGQRRVSGTAQQVPVKAGALQVSASLNYTGHFPYPADNVNPDTWAEMPELAEGLVYDSISITLE